jgi:ribose transport system substrate-binding protein
LFSKIIGHFLCAYVLCSVIGAAMIGAALSRPAFAEEKTFLVGFAQDNMAEQWRSQQVYDLELALKKYPSIKFIHTDARGQVAKAVSDIEGLRDMGIDLLVVSPQNPVLMEPIISAVYQSGTPVVLLTRYIQGDNYTTFIAPNDYAIAREAADEISKSLGGTGDVLILQGLSTASTAIDRTHGFLKQLKNYKNVKVAAIVPGNYLRADAVKVVAAALEKGLHFDAIYSQSDNMAEGARIALRAFGIDPKTIPIVAIDYIALAKGAIKAGEQVASFTYPTCGQEASEVIWSIANGKTVEKKIIVASQKITASNVDEIEPLF